MTLLLLVSTLLFQAPAKNPTAVVFTCSVDHATVTHYEVDIRQGATVVQTINAGKPAADANNDCLVVVNVQPIAFGSYTFVARAVAGAVQSADSVPSEAWDRVPGAPGKPRAQ